MLVDKHYSITGGQALGVPAVFAGAATALGLEAATARTYGDVTEHVASLARPALLKIRYEERTWPGPSPFVDPPGGAVALRSGGDAVSRGRPPASRRTRRRPCGRR